MADRTPFDPKDPFNMCCEHFRKQVCAMALMADKFTIYGDLDRGMQLNAFMAGALTGVIGVCFASIRPEGREALMDALVNQLLPQARQQAEDIAKNAESH